MRIYRVSRIIPESDGAERRGELHRIALEPLGRRWKSLGVFRRPKGLEHRQRAVPGRYVGAITLASYPVPKKLRGLSGVEVDRRVRLLGT